MNANYNAYIAKVVETKEIEGSDFIHAANVLGEWVIVGKDIKEGDIGVFFPVGSALSKEMCSENNLFRKGELNKDNTKTGFLENTGRITAMRLRGAISAGLFLPLESLSFCTKDFNKFKIGENFSKIGKHEICSRYNPPKTKQQGTPKSSKKGKKSTKFLADYFERHVDSKQAKMALQQIQTGSILYFHNKRHGTSSRVGKTKVKYNLPKWKQTINKILPFFKEEAYELVVGSRNVIVNDKVNEGFYGSNDFRMKVAKELEPHLSNGMTIYSEICGYVDTGSSIMPNHNTKETKNKQMIKKYGKSIEYSYGCNPGQLVNFIYRITITTDDGLVMDMPQKVMEEWCKSRDLKCTYDVHEPIVFDGDYKALMKLVQDLTEREEFLGSDPEFPNQLAEGIIIREEGTKLIPNFYKSKNFYFRMLEGHNVFADLEEES